MTVLIVAEHDGAQLDAAFANTLGCALQIGAEIHVLVAAEQAQPIAEAVAQFQGIAKVFSVNSPLYRGTAPENHAALLVGIAAGYSHLLFAAGSFGRSIAPRVAALLDMQPITDVIGVLDDSTFKRPTYAGNVLTTVRSRDALKVLTVRATGFAAAPRGGTAPIEALAAGAAFVGSDIISIDVVQSDRPELGSARVVVSGGRGLGSADNFKILDPLAARLDAAVGASRAAVDLGFAPNDHQVGQTGKVVAPEVYIAVGISGAIQHLAGMRDSKTIFAINKDPEAPICAVADYWLTEDLFTAVPAVVAALAE